MAPLRPVPLERVDVTDAFWAPRIETNRAVTLPLEYEHCQGNRPPRRLQAGLEARRSQPAPHLLGLGRGQVAGGRRLRPRRAAGPQAPAACGRARGRHRRRPAAGRLPQHPLHGGRAGQALDQPARLPRALRRRPPHRGRRGPLPGHGQPGPHRRRLPAGRPRRLGLRHKAGPEARLPGPRGDRAGPGAPLPRDRLRAIPAAGAVLRRRARSAAALLRHGGRRAWRGAPAPALHGPRVQPGAPARARADDGRRPRRARHVPLLCHGRPGSRDRRPRLAHRLPPALAERDRAAHVRHRRHRLLGSRRALHHATTTCRTRPPTRRPAPPSAWSSSRTGCSSWSATAATRT